jgi:hypothetical protein
MSQLYFVLFFFYLIFFSQSGMYEGMEVAAETDDKKMGA